LRGDKLRVQILKRAVSDGGIFSKQKSLDYYMMRGKELSEYGRSLKSKKKVKLAHPKYYIN
jgi:hypothetical protein